MEAESLKLAVEPLGCPICGGPAQMVRRGGACGVKCETGLSTAGEHFVHSYGRTESEAIAAWNTRSSSGENGSALAESASEEPDGSFASDSSRKSEEAARTWILLASIWYDGGFVAETLNERRLQSIMERQGYWPITSDLELITLRNEYRSDRSPDPLTPAAGRAGKAEEGA